MPTIQYKKCLQEMYSLRRFGIKLGLDTIKDILKGLEDPHKRYASIHIAGTNGKGSIASTLASILYAAGYTVGLYTSPHLVRFNERIKINNVEISDQDVVSAYNAVKDVHFGDREPTFFEYTTAMAFQLFSQKEVDWAIIETGMGGRLDATNIIHPAVSVVSNLSLEHQEYLGNTICEIAGEKGGIIKPKAPVVTGVKQKKALAVLDRISAEKQAPLFRLGADFRVRRNRRGWFTYFGMDRVLRDLKTGLPGSHQVENAALALAVCEILIKGSGVWQGEDISIEAIRKGLETNRWPGRLEKISDAPYILLDGAHNLAAVKNLARFLSNHLSDRKITLVAGILDDKAYGSMFKYLLPLCTRVILTSPKIDRSLPPETLYPVAKEMVSEVQIIHDVEEAVKHAVSTSLKDDAVCIAGSLYVVGEAKEAFDNGAIPLNR